MPPPPKQPRRLAGLYSFLYVAAYRLYDSRPLAGVLE
jgi:hypothetical protein